MSTKEKEEVIKARDLIQCMQDIYDLFNSPSMIHMKFMKLHMYSIKRLSHLLNMRSDYNPEGGGRETLYQQQPWSDALPSDPELISSIFCHLLDMCYYGSHYPKDAHKYMINHLITAGNMSNINYLPEDQYAILNTQPLGYAPRYEYVYRRTAYKLPFDTSNLFMAMAMIYGLINKINYGTYGA